MYYKIRWISTKPIKENIDFEKYNHKYELCMEFSKKYKNKNDIINSKYEPSYILKYPINIYKQDTISKGNIIINSNDFKYSITKNDMIDSYISETTYHNNGTLKIKKIKINTTCIYNECNLLLNLTNFKKLYLKLDITCSSNNSICNFATLSHDKKLLLQNNF
tara:strand:- start:408 stop:896 length:489 start_codon:yes stop_codon:yes gene_type:complete